MKVLQIGARSIGRNRRRTLVTTLAMGAAGVMLIFYSGLMEGLFGTLEKNALSMDMGDVQIHAPGYRKDPDLYKRVEGADQIIESLEAAGFRATGRLYGYGLAAAGVSSAGVQIRGVDVDREPNVTRMHAHLGEGEYLSTDDPKGVVVGKRLAKTLGVGLEDEVVVIGQAADGSMANDLYRVRGILKSVGEVVDRGGFLMVDSAYRELMIVPEGRHEIVAMRTHADQPIEDAEAAVTRLAGDNETMSWRKLNPQLAQMLDMSSINNIVMYILTYAAIAMLVLNATLMSVFERIREFGVMKALGVTPLQIAGVVFVEVMVQAALASVLAVGLGVPLTQYFETNGIDLRSIGGTDMSFVGVAIEPIWYCELKPDGVILPVVSLFVMVGLAALYPGIKAAVIRPLDAIRHR